MDLESDKPFAKEVGESDFRDEVVHSDRPVLVVFWAPGSGACETIRPVALELAARCRGRAKFLHANVEENPALGFWYDIQFVPSLLCFVGGEVKMQFHGTASLDVVLEKLESILGPFDEVQKPDGQ